MAPFCKEVCFRAFGTIILAVKTRSSTLTANNESVVSLYWLKSDSSYHIHRQLIDTARLPLLTVAVMLPTELTQYRGTDFPLHPLPQPLYAGWPTNYGNERSTYLDFYANGQQPTDLVGRSESLPTFEKVCKESIDDVLEIEIAWKYFDQVQCDQMMEFKVAQFFPILPKK